MMVKKSCSSIFFSVFFTAALFLGLNLGHAQRFPSSFESFKYSLDEDFSKIDAQKLAAEVSEILDAQKTIGEKEQWNIDYWNAAYPSYRWHQLLMQVSKNHEGHKNGARVVIMHLAIYDALVEVLKHSTKTWQKSPSEYDQRIEKLAYGSEQSSFPCEWSAAAGAAHRIIHYYFPEQKKLIDSCLRAFKKARLATGLEFPTAIAKGVVIGQKIADKYIAYAKEDRTNLKWNGSVPKKEGLWSGNPSPWDPMKRQWKPLALDAPDQFRPAPPPKDWTADMEELRQFNAKHKKSEIAWKWKSQPIWDRLVERKILEYNLNPLEAAFANAVFHTARFDAIIAAWDGKYHYWGIRPFQYDSDFEPILIDTPNFPGYPAGHTTVAGSIAKVLSFLFPNDETSFFELAKECSESRFEGGVHFRTDNEVGLEVGYQVGEQVIKIFTDH